MAWRLAGIAAISVAIGATSAMGGSLPAIKSSAGNAVPECVTADRLMAFVQARNGDLDQRFSGIAATYKQVGEELQVRWDIAFFQMMVETGHLSFKRNGRLGDVLPSQNNFAGMGATGHGEPGEKFASIEAGVRAHLQHVLMYAGEHIDAPVAERTRKVQEWGVLTAWQKGFKRQISFSDLTQKWSPGDHSYSSTIDAIAEKFKAENCGAPPMMKAEAATTPDVSATATAQPTEAKSTGDVAAAINPNRQGGVSVIETAKSKSRAETGSGADLAKQAIERAKTEGDGVRTGLGAKSIGRATTAAPPQREPDASAVKPATVAAIAPSIAPAPVAKQQCRVFTASYGGIKSVIIKQLDGLYANYTVLDVNDDEEDREVRAYIGAYARNGQKVGEFRNQPEALDEAFKLCPEG